MYKHVSVACHFGPPKCFNFSDGVRDIENFTCADEITQFPDNALKGRGETAYVHVQARVRLPFTPILKILDPRRFNELMLSFGSLLKCVLEGRDRSCRRCMYKHVSVACVSVLQMT
jgi:hypothetical protein